MRYLIGIIGVGAVWLAAGQYVTQAAQRLDSKVRRMSSHELNMDLASQRLAEKFKAAGVDYPPKSTALVFVKDTKELILYAGPAKNQLRPVHRYPVLAASGGVGPKLKEGDEQVPEGLYKIVLLNPKSQFHLSLRVNYPNEFDRQQAKAEKRTRLGGDIMIHGEAVSIGCIAIGNVAIEEVYRLAELTDFKKWEVILTPVDFRTKRLPEAARRKLPWLDALYLSIEKRLVEIPL